VRTSYYKLQGKSQLEERKNEMKKIAQMFVITLVANVGVTYSASTKKLAEHGGFAHDDTNVIMLLSNPRFDAKTVTSPVETMQVAPTILKALGLDPDSLQAVQQEGTEVLPGLDFDTEPK
jgi:arylsulfatase A-like enzyme